MSVSPGSVIYDLSAHEPSYRPHDGWLEMARPFITAYKAGSKSVGDYINRDQIIYWYRPSLKSANCDSTDNTMKPADDSTGNFFQGLPNGVDTLSDAIFVVALLTEAGTVQVSSGSNTKTLNGQKGANAWAVDMGVGKQTFSLTRGGNTFLSGTSLKDISGDCVCGIYNFNAYVGTLPASEPDALQSPDAFQGFTSGLAPGICQPTPSLGTAPPARLIPTEIATGTTSSISGPNSSNTHSSSNNAASSIPAIATSITSSSAQPSVLTTTVPTATAPGTGGGSSTITALSQLFPMNCMQAGQVWAGPAGSDPPAKCDG